MRFPNLSVIAVIVHSVSVSWAVALGVSIAARSRFCENAPGTLAGTPFNPRSLPVGVVEIRKSTNTVLWCAPGSRTYVILTMTGVAVETTVSNVLNAAAGYMEESIRQYGDIVIPGGGVDYNFRTGLSFSTSNSNNHQQTYGVLAAAIEALKDYMGRNYYGKASFYIYDGLSEVGEGKIA